MGDVFDELVGMYVDDRFRKGVKVGEMSDDKIMRDFTQFISGRIRTAVRENEEAANRAVSEKGSS